MNPEQYDPPNVMRVPADRHVPITHDEEVVVALTMTQFDRIRRGHRDWYTARRITAAANRIRKAGE